MYADAMKCTFKVLLYLSEADRETWRLLNNYTQNHEKWGPSIWDISRSIRAAIDEEVFLEDLGQNLGQLYEEYERLLRSLYRIEFQ